jgi:hypothetical protein
MKKIQYKSIAVVLVSWLMVGCTSDWLEVPVNSQLTIENFYKTQADAEMAVTAAYSVLKLSAFNGETAENGTLHGINGYFGVGEICSDNAEKGGENRNNGIELAELSEFIPKTENGICFQIWRDAYLGIYRCNVALEKIPTINFSINDPAGYDLKERYIAEVKFIRAYLYFFITQVYGDVPLVIAPLTPSDYTMGRTPKALVYQQIEKDLMEAIPALPKKSEYSVEQMGRVTKGAAQALLAKTYLFQEKWSDARKMAKAVMEDGSYNLNTPYSKIFTIAGENCPESVFEIQYREAGDGSWHSMNDGNTLAIYTGSRDPRWPLKDGGWGFMLPTQNLVDEFEADDPRLDLTVVFNGEDDPWGLGVKLYTDWADDPAAANKTNPTGYICQKYLCAPDRLPNNWSDAPNNVALIRFSDVVLFYAEASYYLGDENEARRAVNMVRERARKEAKDPTTALPDVTASGTSLLNAIWHERRVELALEGHRFFDLVRQKRAAEVINAYYATNPVLTLNNPFTKGVNEVFPIPQSQIDISNGNLTQNPGY